MPEPYHPAAANIRLLGRSTGNSLALTCRLTPAFIGIALAAFALALECYRYLYSGAYLDHVEGNVVTKWLAISLRLSAL